MKIKMQKKGIIAVTFQLEENTSARLLLQVL